MFYFIAGLVALLLAGKAIHESRKNKVLQNRLSVVESSLVNLNSNIQSLEQKHNSEDWQAKLTAEYKEIFEKIKKDVAKELKQNKDDLNQKLDYEKIKKELKEKLDKEKEGFDKIAKSAYEKACEEIKFHEINYKKTVTLKRKEYTRKNKKNAKAKRTWRYIDEE